MNESLSRTLEPYYNVRHLLESIPQDLWDIFLPSTDAGLLELETRIVNFKAREVERQRVMAIQELCDFPLRPNATLKETQLKARLEGIRKDQLRRRRNGDPDAVN